MKCDIKIENKKFNADLQKILEKVDKKEVPNFLRKVAFALLSLIIKRNPVDTGRSRAGWYPAASKLGIPKMANSSGEEDGEYQEKLQGKKKEIIISNRVVYTQFLEYGHSKQAPSGMVRVSLREVSRKLKDKFRISK